MTAAAAAVTTAIAASGSPQEIRAVAELVHHHAGIVLPPAKASFVASRLGASFRRSGLPRFGDYVERLRHDETARREAIEALTTNHTGFFREAHHFTHFTENVRPALLARAARREPLRFWSAGSSTGEEVHSLTLALLGSDPAQSRSVLSGDVRFLATDINAQVLEIGSRGRYPATALASVPADLRRAWAEPEGDEVAFRGDLRALLRFRRLNLLAQWPIRARFDVIFCRNTMIYFDEPTKARLLARLVDRLLPGGHLYIGHSERVVGPAVAHLESLGQTIYRKRAA